MTTPFPIEEAFPPNSQPFSVRVQQIDEYKNPEIRKVLHTIYKNADGSPVMDYYKALSTPPSGVRAALLEHEISKGYVVDDRNVEHSDRNRTHAETGGRTRNGQTTVASRPRQRPRSSPETVLQGSTEAAPVMQPPTGPGNAHGTWTTRQGLRARGSSSTSSASSKRNGSSTERVEPHHPPPTRPSSCRCHGSTPGPNDSNGPRRCPCSPKGQ